MTPHIVDRDGVLAGPLHEFAQRRLLFALSRFDSKIQRVDLVVADTNGPRGGVDKSCRISVKLRRAKEVTITDQDSNIATCVARAAERAGRAVARAIERTQRFDRPTPFAADPMPHP